MTIFSGILFALVLIGHLLATFRTDEIKPFNTTDQALRMIFWMLMLTCYIHLVFFK